MTKEPYIDLTGKVEIVTGAGAKNRRPLHARP